MKLHALILFTVSAIAGISACTRESESPDEFKGWVAQCTPSTDGLGTWTSLLPPVGVLGIAHLAPRHKFSDGETFTVFRGQALGFLGPGDSEWSTGTTDRDVGISGWVWAASDSYLLVQGGTSTWNHSQDFLNQAELLNLSSGNWITIEPSQDLFVPTFASGAFWDGKRFLLPYTGRNFENDQVYLSAVALDPMSQEWSALPRLEVGSWTEDGEPTNGTVDGTVVEDSLLIWGILPDESRTFGARLVGDSWRNIPQEGSPSVRKYHDIVAADDGMYVVGGIHPDSDSTWDWYGEIWHYSLTHEEWTQIDVPDFVDPKKGAWLDGKLYVFGECASDAVYDPAQDSWQLLPPLDVPDYGVPMVAGGRIFLTEVTEPHGSDVPEVFIYDPLGSPSGLAGAPNH